VIAQLVFVHGRAQEHKDAVGLKADWISALRKGLAKSHLDLPIREDDIRFPYYGDTLYDLVAGEPQAAEVIVKGDEAATTLEERTFMASIILEAVAGRGVNDDEIARVAGASVVERNTLNWLWVRAALQAIDEHFPGSGAALALFAYDVHRYLNNLGIRDEIEMGVRKAFQTGGPIVVVGHSLGTVVSYCLLRREGKANGWGVPLYVTLGSPLAVTRIKKSLAPNKHPECVGTWFNAMDPVDAVALYPLDAGHFPIAPAIENKTDVANHTSNHHGIVGYLDDKEVARRIYAALT
jgi:hypothetical protein